MAIYNREDSRTALPAINGGITRLSSFVTASMGTTDTYYIQVYQNSGSTLDVHYAIEAVRIR